MEDIIQKICKHYKVLPHTIAKPKHGSLPELAYGEVLHRILLGTNSLARDFPELCKDSTSKLLKKLFPGKTRLGQSWRTFILAEVGLKRCPHCEQIKELCEFSVNKKEPDGLRAWCRECSGESWKEHYSANQDMHKQRSRDYYQENAEERRLYAKYSYYANPEYYRAQGAKRRATELDACAAWGDIDEIDRIYLHCPDGYHVDHIVPLQGKLVCGLHVEHNLQYLTAKQNLQKSNTFDIDAYQHDTTYVPPYLTQGLK